MNGQVSNTQMVCTCIYVWIQYHTSPKIFPPGEKCQHIHFSHVQSICVESGGSIIKWDKRLHIAPTFHSNTLSIFKTNTTLLVETKGNKLNKQSMPHHLIGCVHVYVCVRYLEYFILDSGAGDALVEGEGL